MNAALVMFKADGSRREFALGAGPTVVGRKNSCDLRIPLTSVSRQHCEFRVEGSGVKLRDLGSSNGTFRNGQRVQEADLSPGDHVVVGPVQFTLTVDGQPADVEPVRTVLEPQGPPKASGASAAVAASAASAVPPSMELDDPASSQANVASADAITDAVPESDDSALDLDLSGPGPDADAEDDDLASAMSSMEDDPDGSSGIAFDFDDDETTDLPDIEILDTDDDNK